MPFLSSALTHTHRLFWIRRKSQGNILEAFSSSTAWQTSHSSLAFYFDGVRTMWNCILSKSPHCFASLACRPLWNTVNGRCWDSASMINTRRYSSCCRIGWFACTGERAFTLRRALSWRNSRRAFWLAHGLRTGIFSSTTSSASMWFVCSSALKPFWASAMCTTFKRNGISIKSIHPYWP